MVLAAETDRGELPLSADIAAGIGVLVFLRTQGVGADLLNADEPTIDYPLDAAVNVNTEQRQTEVLDALANSNIVAQVPSEQIEKNPFFLQSITSSGETIAEAGAAPEPVAPTGPTPEEIRLEELDRLAAPLELNTVISGRISLARINGKTYRIGDTIADTFNRLYYFERAAETYIRALQTGAKLRVLSDEIAEKTAQEMEDYPDMATAHLAELKAILDAEGSDYAR